MRANDHPATWITAPSHPLAPLTPAELQEVVAIVKASRYFDADSRFEMIDLLESSKSCVREWAKGRPFARSARVTVFQFNRLGVLSLTVSLDKRSVISAHVLPDQRPMIQLEQFGAIEGIVRSDPLFIAACAKRGITDMSKVCVDPWSAGNFGKPDEAGRFLCHVFAWLRHYENENFYAHPIEGLNAIVDLCTSKVIRIDDYGVVPVPTTESNYDADLVKSKRAALKPINVVQPEGVNFKIADGLLTWDRWSLVVGFNAREALTLHDVRYDGRPVVYRASLVEMVVPYGTPERGHYRKNVFDVGEYGIGKLTNSLTLGCDCLGTIEYLDVHLNKMDGSIMTIKQAICIHEEDAGLLWKHMDFRTERTEVRRSRKLVISSIATVGNYEYALYWYLYLDGAIEFEVKATGIINTAACLPGQPGRYATEVAPGLIGHIHQHVFCARLDMAVDGEANSFVECNTFAEPAGPDNPYGNAFYEEQTVLRSELEAARRSNPDTMRYWKVVNPNVKNWVGTPVGYRLEANHTVTPFVAPDSYSGRRSGFTQKHVWVTAFNTEERYPAGDYMNHSSGETDIASFVAQNRSIENTDIVLWHVFGLHHPVRMEDFPVQPCISTGFKLVPSGFFDRNPAIDLPPIKNAASCCAQASA